MCKETMADYQLCLHNTFQYWYFYQSYQNISEHGTKHELWNCSPVLFHGKQLSPWYRMSLVASLEINFSAVPDVSIITTCGCWIFPNTKPAYFSSSSGIFGLTVKLSLPRFEFSMWSNLSFSTWSLSSWMKAIAMMQLGISSKFWTKRFR